MPLLAREHRIEILGIEIAIVDLVAGGRRALDGRAVQRRAEARLDRMGEEDEDRMVMRNTAPGRPLTPFRSSGRLQAGNR